MTVRGYRQAGSYLSQDPEKRARQRANLLQGRAKRARRAELKPKRRGRVYIIGE